MNICQLEQLRNLIQTSHINFLFGSGLSCPFLKTLNSIEKLLTAAQSLDKDLRTVVEASLFGEYFNSVMAPCMCDNLIAKKQEQYSSVVNTYEHFLSIWNAIMAKRDTSLLDKIKNIFTTNIDNLVEKAAEHQRLEFNDGFKGYITPTFREDSFNNVLTKISPLYQNLAHIPIFNYIKIHGSINWKKADDEVSITYDRDLDLIRKIKETYDLIPNGQLVSVASNDDIDQLVNRVKNMMCNDGYEMSPSINTFMDAYWKLIMIHPRKTKFKESVIDSHFYELMRRYSNTLEQSNTLLFVSGFSFADEHLAKITVRAANTNPTLQIVVFAFNEESKHTTLANIALGGTMLNDNIIVISPEDYYKGQKEDEREFIRECPVWNTKVIEEKNGEQKEKIIHVFSLEVINEVIFKRILGIIN